MYENFQFGSRWKEILDWRGWGKEKWGWEWVLELVLNWGMIFYVRIFAGPAGAADRPLAAGCLLAAMPLRDSWCPVGAVPPYGWGVTLAGKTAFSFVGKREVFTLQLVFCLPGWGQNHFFFCLQKKKRFWTPKKKRETSGNLGVVRYNRIDYLC